MSELSNRLAGAAKRAETWGKRAVVTAEVAAQVVSPMVGPVAQETNLVSAKSAVETSQDIVRGQQEDWADKDLQMREQQTNQVRVTREHTTSQTVRVNGDRSTPRSKERSRER